MTIKIKRYLGLWATLRVSILISAMGTAATAAAAWSGLTSSAAVVPVTIVLATLIATAHYWKTQQALILSEQYRVARERFGDLEQKLDETHGLIQLGNLGLPYPLPFGGDYALTGDAAAVLARQVALLRPRTTVEFGSGVSTVLVATLLKEHGGGRIYALDHDREWAEVTRTLIAAAGLQDYAEVFDAPLTMQDVDGKEYHWYRIPEAVEALHEIDLLIVDGPPQKIDPEGLPRYPALPKLLPKLSEKAEIFVDDAKRPQEQEMIQLWLERFPGWKAFTLPTVPGTCLVSRDSSSGRKSVPE